MAPLFVSKLLEHISVVRDARGMAIPSARPLCHALVLFALPFEFYIACRTPFMAKSPCVYNMVSPLLLLRFSLATEHDVWYLLNHSCTRCT
jgi:hypothetical protein